MNEMHNGEQSMESTVGSVLRIPHVIFDEITFFRKGFKNDKNESLSISVSNKTIKDGDGQYRVTLQVDASKEDEYDARVKITGFCQVDESYEHKDTLLKENAVAILFAYVRSELTLITSQPETDPIVLPVVNITAMIQQADHIVE